MHWLRIFLLNLTVFGQLALCIVSDWSIPLEFSVADLPFQPFGKIVIRENSNGEFVGDAGGVQKQLFGAFKPTLSTNQTAPVYKIRSGGAYSSSHPCLFIRSNFAHEIALSVDVERRKVFSLTLFPYGSYDLRQIDCSVKDLENLRPKFSVKVQIVHQDELPGPDTATYLQKIDEEKRARQHGATQDNRSFLAKYWIYIVPVVIFMVVSNAFNIDQQGQQE